MHLFIKLYTYFAGQIHQHARYIHLTVSETHFKRIGSHSQE